MGASEQQGEGAITVSNNGVTVEKQLVEDEFPIPTIKFRIVNERNDAVSVTLSETVPEDFSIGTLGFHPDHGSEHWTCLDDDKAEFDRDLGAGGEVETLYGIRIDDLDRAAAFMTQPAIGSVTPVDPDESDELAGSPEASDDDVEPADADGDTDAGADEEPVTLSLNEEGDGGIVEDGNGSAESPEDGDDYGTETIDDDLPEGEIDIGGISTAETDSLHVEEVLGSDDPEIELSVPTEPSDAGPEDGAVIDRLVEELERADVDAEQKEVLREQLDVGVPSETQARIESLGNRIETLAAYTDSLEEFLDENGTAQQLLEGFETQVDALRDDVATIRHHTRANASDIAELNGNILDLEDHVADVEDRLESVAEHAETIEDDLAETDDHLDGVEADLDEAEESIAANEDDIAALDEHLVEVDDELGDVEDRVSTTEEVVEELETTTDEIAGDVETVERRVTATEADAWAHDDRLDVAEETLADLESVADDHEADIDDLESETDEIRTDLDEETADIREELDAETEAIRTDLDEGVSGLEDELADVEADIDDLLTWRDELGEMFQ